MTMKAKIVLGVIVLFLIGAFAYGNVSSPEKQQEDVEILSSAETVPVVPLDCPEAFPEKSDCYTRHYQTLTGGKGSAVSFQDLKARYAQDPFVKAQCHPLTHAIGRVAALDASVGEAFAQGDSFCWSGYYHGVMEAVASRIGKANIKYHVNDICKDIRKKKTFDYYNCVHGLGHGFMAISYDELFESLATCDYLKGGWEQGSCWGGVFMENIIVDEEEGESKYLKADDPLYPCNAVSDKYRAACYLMHTSHMLKVEGDDFRKVFSLCGTIPEPYKNLCYQSLGRDASGHTVSDVEKSKTLCLLGQNEREQYNCFLGAAKDFVSYFRSDARARELCRAAPEAMREPCLKEIAEFYKIY